MKRSILFVAAMLVASVAFPQDFITGPSYKNAKVGKSIGPKVPVVFNSQPGNLKGPDAKNYKTWNSEGAKIQVRTRKVIDNPQGLQAKNPRYGINSDPLEVSSKASYMEPKSMRRRKIWWH